MKRQTLVLVVVLGGAAGLAYVYRKELGLGGGSQQAQVGGLLGALLPQLNEALTNLRDPNSEEREGLRNLGRAGDRVFGALGLGPDPRTRKRRNDSLAQASYYERVQAERWAQGLFSAASRSDVREWSVDQSGGWIYYEGRADPWHKPLPSGIQWPAAWILEASARILAPVGGGAVPQRELGPFGHSVGKPGKLSWLRYEEPAFSDNNPAAPPDWTISGLFNPPTFGLVQEDQNPLLRSA